MGNQGDSSNELTRVAARPYYKVPRNLTGPAKVPLTPPVSFDSVKSTRRQTYVSAESVDMPLSAIATSPAEQQEYMAALERRLNASIRDMQTLPDYEEQHTVITSIVKEAIVYTLLAILPLAAGVGLGCASHLGADVVLSAAAEVMPR